MLPSILPSMSLAEKPPDYAGRSGGSKTRNPAQNSLGQIFEEAAAAQQTLLLDR